MQKGGGENQLPFCVMTSDKSSFLLLFGQSFWDWPFLSD